jgi:PHD/YefM family antitoxin component YafN of YafNO toxin-antitoxin module
MAKVRKRYITDENGKQVAVVVPIAEYEAMIEDLHDLAVLAERRSEQPVPADEFKARLLADGDV